MRDRGASFPVQCQGLCVISAPWLERPFWLDVVSGPNSGHEQIPVWPDTRHIGLLPQAPTCSGQNVPAPAGLKRALVHKWPTYALSGENCSERALELVPNGLRSCAPWVEALETRRFCWARRSWLRWLLSQKQSAVQMIYKISHP